MALNLADVRYPEETSVIRDRIKANLVAEGLPVADWVPAEAGGVEMLRLNAVSATTQERLAKKVALLAELVLIELATGDRLTLLAKKRYLIDRDPATKTIQSVALWMDGTPSSKDFHAGDLIAGSDATGNHYLLIDDGTLNQQNTAAFPVSLRFEAEVAGSAYADAAETITRLVTARAGVRCANRRPKDFLDAVVNGSSTGNVLAFFAVPNTTPSYGSVRLRIDTDGDIGTATYSYSLDGGSVWTPAGPIPGGINIVFPGTQLAFSNGSSPSFLAGDIFTLLVGSHIITQGADEETDDSLRTRCRQRWMSLSDVPIEGIIDLWAHLASREVERVLADADPNTPGSIIVTIASKSGPASPTAVIAVQDYIGSRLRGYKGIAAASGFFSVEEKAQVSSASPKQITAGGTVLVQRSKITDVKLAAETAWLAYLRGLPLGGQPNAVVRLQELVQAVMDAGAVDILNPTLNALTTNITLLFAEVAVPATGRTLLNSLVWQPV